DGHVVQRQVAAQVADGAALGARPARESRPEGQVGHRSRHAGGDVNDAEREVAADRQGVLAKAGDGERAGGGGGGGGEGDGLGGGGGVGVDRVRPGRGVGREDGGAEGDGAGRGYGEVGGAVDRERGRHAPVLQRLQRQPAPGPGPCAG